MNLHFQKINKVFIFTKILLFSHKTPADFMNYLRFLAAFFILSVCFSCKTKEVVKPNSPPNAFTVTATLAANGKDIILKWTKSKDPDGDAVTYSVVYKDTLIRHLNDTTYIIKNVPYDTEVKGSIVAKDLKGGATVAQFSSKTLSLYIKIPDINFENALIRLKIDDIQDGQVLRGNAEKVINLDLGTKEENDKISNSTGIEAFYNLKNLSFNNNKLELIDITKNIALERLDCSYNKLTNINLLKNINLEYLYCNDNQLTNLDISQNVLLKDLFCRSNQLQVLDIKNSTNLLRLYCSYNQLTTLDINKNTFLNYLICNGNKIQTICVNSLNQVKPDWQKDASATYKICN
jgi:hypothetical protein